MASTTPAQIADEWKNLLNPDPKFVSVLGPQQRSIFGDYLARHTKTSDERKTRLQDRFSTRPVPVVPVALENLETLALQMDAVKAQLTSPTERIQFFAFLKELFTVHYDKSKSTDEERKRLDLLTAAYEAKLPTTAPRFVSPSGKLKIVLSASNYFLLRNEWIVGINKSISFSTIPYFEN